MDQTEKCTWGPEVDGFVSGLTQWHLYTLLISRIISWDYHPAQGSIAQMIQAHLCDSFCKIQ